MTRLIAFALMGFALVWACASVAAQEGEKGNEPPAISPPPPGTKAPAQPQKTSTGQSEQQPQKQPSASSAVLQMVLFMVLVFGLFYVMLILPQKRRQKEHQQMIANLRKNDKVVTIGGIHGVVHSVRDDKIVLKVDENTKLTFSINAIASVETQKEEDVSQEKEEKK